MNSICNTRVGPGRRMLGMLLCLAMFLSVAAPAGAIAPEYESEAIGDGDLDFVQPVLAVTGDGLIAESRYTAANVSNEKSYTLDELKAVASADINASAENQYLYSAINSSQTKSFYRGEGVIVNTLLALSGIETFATPDEFSVGDAQPGFDASPGSDAPPGSDAQPGFTEPPESIKFRAADGFTVTLNNPLSPRYFYPDIVSDIEETRILTPTIISWAGTGGRNEAPALTSPPLDSARDYGGLLGTMAGQLNVADVNNSLFSNASASQTILIGNDVAVKPVTILGTPYSRAEMLMMPRTQRDFTYTTQNGERTDSVRGVPLSCLLEDLDGGDVVEFATADDWAGISAYSMSKSELIAKNAVLAYERYNGSALQGYLDSDADGGRQGFFRLFADGLSPAQRICNISVKPAAASAFKHIDYAGAPYNVDAITGATLTVEGPGVVNSVPITARQLEEAQDANIFRGVYSDLRNGAVAERAYEGVRVLSILNGSVNSNVVPLDENVEVVFKNRWRQEVSRMSYGEISRAAQPVILAYGTAYADGSAATPFVFNLAPGIVAGLGNDDGPLKLVYDQGGASGGPPGARFSSVAYMYVEEGEPPPGFKHITAANDAYDNAANTEYILTFTGSELGREVNYTVRELEKMAEDDESLVFRDEYSLSNTTYWYVNEYEGLKLWDLLVSSGADAGAAIPKNSAVDDVYGAAADDVNATAVDDLYVAVADDTPLVSFSSWDNYQISSQFSFYQLAHPELFRFYEKSPLDIGTDRPTKAQLSTPEYQPGNQIGDWTADENNYPVKAGYPVLLAYGVNSYPYVRNTGMDGYKSGLGNSGGPMRLIYGKTDGLNRANPDADENYAYFFNNGSQQLQRLQEIYAGDATRYSTHLQNPAPAYQDMKGQTALTVEVTAGGVTRTVDLSLAELEEILYGPGVAKRDRDNEGRQEKGYYYYRDAGGSPIEDLFEGVSLEYLLTERVGLQGMLGTVDLYSGGNLASTFEISGIGMRGANSLRGTDGLGMAVAFAKNGYPLVAGGNNSSNASPGYVHDDPVTGRAIRNGGGPLLFVRGQTAAESDDGRIETGVDNKTYVDNLTKIVVNLDPDPYAHTGADNAELAGRQILFSGAVARSEGVAFTVGELETKQRYIVDGEYMISGADGETGDGAGGDAGDTGGADGETSGVGGDTGETDDEGEPGGGAGGDTSGGAIGGETGGGAGSDAGDTGGGAEFFRGLDLFALLYDKDIGVSALMNEITVKNADGGEKTLSYDELSGAGKKIILAYGRGYGEDARPLGLADGGPMRLVIDGGSGAECISGVVEIIVNAASISSWKHNFGAYSQYADYKLEISGQNLVHNKTYSIAELEAMDNIIVQDSYKVGSNAAIVQGVELYKLLQNIGFAGGAESSVFTAYASDGYSPGAFTASQLKDGINGKPVLVAFGQGAMAGDGLPLVPNDASAGYDSSADNQGGPLRLMIHDNSGWSVKFLTRIVVGQEGGAADPSLPADYGCALFPGGENGMPMASIRAVAPDGDGGVWVGSNGAGAAYISEFGDITSFTTPNLRTDFVAGVAVAPDGGVWLSQGGSVGSVNAPPTAHYGFARYSDGNFEYFGTGSENSALPNDCVYGLDVGMDGNVWLATQHTLLNGGMEGGLTRFNPAANTWRTWKMSDGLPTVSAWAIKADAKGGAWVTTYRTSNLEMDWPDQSYAYVNAAGAVVPYPIPAATDYSWSRSVSIDPEGGVYITRMSGAHDPANDGGWLDYISPVGAVKSFKGDVLIPDLKSKSRPGFYPEIRTVYVDAGGDLWLATNGLGVYRCAVKDGAVSIIDNFSSESGSWPEGAFDDVWSLAAVKDAADGGTSNAANGGAMDAANGSAMDAANGGAIDAANNATHSEAGIDASNGTVYFGSNGGLAAARVSLGCSEPPAPPEPPEPPDPPDPPEPPEPPEPADPSATHVGDATEDTAQIKIIGAVEKPGYFTIAGLKTISVAYEKTRDYAWQNNSGSTGTDTFTGIYIENLLNNVMKLKNDAASVTLAAADGFSYTFALDAGDTGAYRTDASGGKAMLAWRGTASRTDRNIVDYDLPRLAVGQIGEGHVNRSAWVTDITLITVGSKEPSPPDDKPKDPTRPAPPPVAGDAVLAIYNGTTKAKEFKQSDIDALSKVTNSYSAYNSWPTYSAYMGVSGVTVSRLLSAAGVNPARNSEILFYSSDGFYAALTYADITAARWFFGPGGARGAQVPAIIAFGDGDSRLYFGQRSAQEQTSPNFVLNVDRIAVGGSAGKWGAPMAYPPAKTAVKAGDPIRLSLPGGAEDAKIYYTLDGSAPTINSAMYNVTAERWFSQKGMTEHPPIPAPKDGEFNIKAVVIGVGKEDGDVATFNYNGPGAVPLPGVGGGPPEADDNTADKLVDGGSGGGGGEDSALYGGNKIPGGSARVSSSGYWGENPFGDVGEGDWYYESVRFVYENEMMTGAGEDRFEPDAEMSRAMAVTVIHRLAGAPEILDLTNPFTDVQEGAWYYEAVVWAAANGIVVGYGDGRFGPDDGVTREQLAVILYRYQRRFGYAPEDSGAKTPGFEDWEDVSDWAKEAVAHLTAYGVILGKPGNLFDPGAGAVRSEFAAMLQRFCEKVKLNDINE